MVEQAVVAACAGQGDLVVGIGEFLEVEVARNERVVEGCS